MRGKVKAVAWILLLGFIAFIMNTTVFSRKEAATYRYNLQPFWSYQAIMDGKDYLIKENYLNVVLFIPLGILICCALKHKQWWKALLFSTLLSGSIEIIQLFSKRGFCEFDDVMHNTLGCLTGYCIAAYTCRWIGYIMTKKTKKVQYGKKKDLFMPCSHE